MKAMKKIEDAVRELGGVWPSDDADAVYLYKIDNRYIAGLPGGTALHICTRTEFVECTRRLRPEDEKVESKDDWYKRGELPPVGMVCEMRRVGEGFAKGALMYHSAELCVWRFMSSAEIALRPDQCEFRPLQTERERWVEAAGKVAVGSRNHAEFLGRLYDAGLAKMPEYE